MTTVLSLPTDCSMILAKPDPKTAWRMVDLRRGIVGCPMDIVACGSGTFLISHLLPRYFDALHGSVLSGQT